MLKYYITPYIEKTYLKNKMKKEIMQMTGYSREYLETSRKNIPYFFHHDSIKYYQSNAEKNYFNPIIIRFCVGKNLTDEVIQSISEVIESKNVLNNNLAISNQIDLSGTYKISDPNNKLNGKNKIGVWQHFLFGLFFILTCLSLFLCFKISFYFLILVAIFTVCDLYLGFKNYFRGCCCTQKIETSAINKNENNLVSPTDRNEITNSGQKLIDDKLKS